MVARRSRAAIASGKQNLTQARVQLENRLQAARQDCDAAKGRADRCGATGEDPTAALEALAQAEAKAAAIAADIAKVAHPNPRGGGSHLTADKADESARCEGRWAG